MTPASELALANIGIAITRPVGQAKKLSQLIQAAGGSVIPFPLIKIVPLKDDTKFKNIIDLIPAYDWILFISSNAVQNGMPLLLEKGIPNTLRFAAIGPATATALGAFGIKKVLMPEDRFDSESLLSLPDMHDVQDKKILIIRGIGGRELLANTLKSRGANVTFGECYQRVNPQTNCDKLAKAYANHQLQSIIVTSSEAMRYLLALSDNATWLRDITICVNHVRIAEQALKMGLKTMVADAPGDAAMMDLLLKAPKNFKGSTLIKKW